LAAAEEPPDPLKDYREAARLSEWKEAIDFSKLEDFDFKAAGEGTSRFGITARNVKNAKEFRVYKGALVITADEPHYDVSGRRKEDDTFARWEPSDRSAPYAEINARYKWKRSFPSGIFYDALYHNVTVQIELTACDEALVILADSQGVPGDGNSQVFRASRWHRVEGGNTSLHIFNLYAEKRGYGIDDQSRFQQPGQATPEFSQIKIEAVSEPAGTRFGMEVFSEGKTLLKGGGISKGLAFWDDYGIAREPELRICVGTTESPNPQTATVSIKKIEANGKWDPPFLKKRQN
jgi:hypothetical protein